MKQSIINKLDSTAERLEEISALLSDPEIISNQERFRNLSQEFSQIEPTVKLFHKYKVFQKNFSLLMLELQMYIYHY